MHSTSILPKILILMTLFGGTAFADIPVFQNAHVYFGGGENRRSLTSEVELPNVEENFSKIELQLSLNCPNDRCDWWDRKAGLYLIQEDGQELELMRFMTPYRVGASWTVDVTDLRPLLSGKTLFRVFIDTWVGPGHPQGEGWLVDVKLKFTEGEVSRPVDAIIPIFSPESVIYGELGLSSERNTSLDLSNYQGKTGRIWSFITGHGQGNTENCAEFCPKQHRLQVGNQIFEKTIWRDNCRETVTDGTQLGTWQYSRAGWCPGDHVPAWIEDFTLPASIGESGSAEPTVVSWAPESYVNQNNDGYNSGGHTEPYYQVSAFLILYK